METESVLEEKPTYVGMVQGFHDAYLSKQLKGQQETINKQQNLK